MLQKLIGCSSFDEADRIIRTSLAEIENIVF